MAEATTPDIDKLFTDYVAARAVYEPHNRAVQTLLNEVAVKVEKFIRKAKWQFWDENSEMRKFRALEAFQTFGYYTDWYVDANAKNIRFEVESPDYSEYFNVSWADLLTVPEKLEEAYAAWEAKKASDKAEAEKKKKNAAAAAKARAEYEKFAAAGYYN